MSILAYLIWSRGQRKFVRASKHGEFTGPEDERLYREDKEELANEAKLLATAK